jgi:PAS domain S-box-containing protein
VQMGLRGKVLTYLLVGGLAFGGITLAVANNILEQIKVELSRYAAERYVQYNREKTLGGIQADLALATKMADTDVLRRWMLNPRDVATADAAIKELRSLIRLYSTHETFVATKSTGGYYQIDAKALDIPDSAVLKPLNILSRDDKDDIWFFNTLAQKEPFNLNVDYNDKLKATKLWINVVAKNGNEPIGVVGTGIDISKFINEFVKTSEKGITGIYFNAEGAIQGHANTALIAQNAPVAMAEADKTIWNLFPRIGEQEQLRQAIAALGVNQEVTRTVTLTVDGQERIGAVAYIAPLKWYTLAILDHTAVTGSGHFAPILLTLALSLVAGAVLTFIASNRLILQPLRSITSATRRVTEGDYSARLSEDRRDEIGDLAVNFNRMASTLVETQRLAKSNIYKISTEMQSAQSFAELAQTFFTHVAPLIDLGQGSFYRLDNGTAQLLLCGGYGRIEGASPDAKIALGSGLVGQCAVERRMLCIESLPADYVGIGSVLLTATPCCLVLRPIMSSDHLLGVLELALLEPLDEAGTTVIDGLMPALAMCIEIIERTERMKRLLVAAQEQTEAMEAQQILIAEREALLKQILEDSPAAVTMVTERGEQLFANRRFADMLGLSSEAIKKRRSSEFWAEPENRSNFIAALKERGQVNDYEAKFRRDDGKEIWVLINTRWVKQEGQHLLLTWMYEITERKQAEDAMRKAQKNVEDTTKTESAPLAPT